MLKDVIDFVMSRTGLTREIALREINFAWNELWNSDDLPNSIQEITVTPTDTEPLLSLPYFVGIIRGVKENRVRVVLNTPRPAYHDGAYEQSPFVWRVLGITPLAKTIENATTITLKISEAETTAFTVTLIGPTDNSTEDREQIIFDIGETEKITTKRFTDCTSIVKDSLTASNVEIVGANDEDYGIIPANAYEARNTIVQVSDKCSECCSSCRCFDVLYKKTAPVLAFDEQYVPHAEVLMTKTLEWITLPKDGQEEKASLFGEKARTLLTAYNHNEVSVEKVLDLGRNKFAPIHYGYL